jgi:hypothetical protein
VLLGRRSSVSVVAVGAGVWRGSVNLIKSYWIRGAYCLETAEAVPPSCRQNQGSQTPW